MPSGFRIDREALEWQEESLPNLTAAHAGAAGDLPGDGRGDADPSVRESFEKARGDTRDRSPGFSFQANKDVGVDDHSSCSSQGL